MSKKKGKQMSNLPYSYIEAMEELQAENNRLKEGKVEEQEIAKIWAVLRDTLRFIKELKAENKELKIELFEHELLIKGLKK